ncbi:MAG TPA: hypothetical protein VK992_06860 [Candidatus Caenarcaniphilales bacterium]|nr:hypothetical protein [Candidatus Caenarcaniphilales bacterium]
MLVEFLGYAADCTVSGQLELAGTRVSDAIDANGELTVRNATLRSLLGTRELFEPELVLERDELLAVEAAGPAGEAAKRICTVRHRLRVELGPYVVLGQPHVLPGASPRRSLRARRRIVPLTDASILVPSDAGLETRQTRVLMVNASHIDAASVIGTDDSPWEVKTLLTTPSLGFPATTDGSGLQLALPLTRR